jgi:hypothetical protein
MKGTGEYTRPIIRKGTKIIGFCKRKILRSYELGVAYRYDKLEK